MLYTINEIDHYLKEHEYGDLPKLKRHSEHEGTLSIFSHDLDNDVDVVKYNDETESLFNCVLDRIVYGESLDYEYELWLEDNYLDDTICAFIFFLIYRVRKDVSIKIEYLEGVFDNLDSMAKEEGLEINAQ